MGEKYWLVDMVCIDRQVVVAHCYHSTILFLNSEILLWHIMLIGDSRDAKMVLAALC